MPNRKATVSIEPYNEHKWFGMPIRKRSQWLNRQLEKMKPKAQP